MGDVENLTLRTRAEELAGDCQIDREDAWQIADAVRPGSDRDRARVADLMRRCAATMEPEAFQSLKAALHGEKTERTERVLLKPGESGSEVVRLRQALSDAAGILGDKRLDPGAGNRFDAALGAALRAFQASCCPPADGAFDSRTLLPLNRVLEGAGRPLLDVERPAPPPPDVTLHFFPGDVARKLVVQQGDRVLDVYDMRGGPEQARADERPTNAARIPLGPTPPGTYRIGGSAAHVTAAWKYSQIPWGAAIREVAGEIQFQAEDGGPWRPATGPDSVFRNQPPGMQFYREDFLRDGQVAGRWEMNDFGHRAVYLERGGRRQGHLVHATPHEEEAYGDDTVDLLESHGCEHMRPADLDEAISKGYFRPGTPFVVHGYNEKPVW